MATAFLRLRRRALLLVLAALGVALIGGTALAGPAGAVKTFTGCLSSGDGSITKVKEGDSPKSTCSNGQTVVKLSGGDITKISVDRRADAAESGRERRRHDRARREVQPAAELL